jgi:hypothetical protein
MTLLRLLADVTEEKTPNQNFLCKGMSLPKFRSRPAIACDFLVRFLVLHEGMHEVAPPHCRRGFLK